MWEELKIDGYSFKSAAEYEAAKHESEAIRYLETKMDTADPHVALKVYNKLLDRQNFSTVIGYSYLCSLRKLVVDSQIAEENELRPVVLSGYNNALSENATVGDEDALEKAAVHSEIADSDPKVTETISELDDREIKYLKRDLKASRDSEAALKTEIEKYKTKIKSAIIVIIALVVIIAAIFVVSVRRNSMNFDSAEIAMQDKYSAWAEELDALEAELNARETELDEREQSLNNN